MSFQDDVYDRFASIAGLQTDKLRVQSSTFENYVPGTVGVVFFIFLAFILIQIMTLLLMGYARYLKNRRPKPGFYNPPPMVERYRNYKTNGSSSRVGTLRSDYSKVSTDPMQSRQLNTAMSSTSERTATSTML